MKLYMRLLWSVPLLGVAAFSVIGSWYSFAELGGFNVFVAIYGCVAAACLAAAVHICFTAAPSAYMKLASGLLSLACFGFLVWLCVGLAGA
jgi:hypothetical protein